LFNFYRLEIYWLCRKLHIPIWTDRTNYNYSNSRNKLRNEVFPYLRKFFNPQLDVEMNNLLKFVSYETEYIQIKGCFYFKLLLHTKKIAIQKTIFNILHQSLQRRIIYLTLVKSGISYLNLELIDMVLESYTKVKEKNTIIKVNSEFALFIGSRWIYVTKRTR
jgi:tRNA(Ile)-lysidine synthase TilS/MesJ